MQLCNVSIKLFMQKSKPKFRVQTSKPTNFVTTASNME